jgi:hypothetical protein
MPQCGVKAVFWAILIRLSDFRDVIPDGRAKSRDRVKKQGEEHYNSLMTLDSRFRQNQGEGHFRPISNAWHIDVSHKKGRFIASPPSIYDYFGMTWYYVFLQILRNLNTAYFIF